MISDNIMMVIFSFCGIKNRLNLLLVNKNFNKCCDIKNLFIYLSNEDKKYIVKKAIKKNKISVFDLSILFHQNSFENLGGIILEYACMKGDINLVQKIINSKYINQILYEKCKNNLQLGYYEIQPNRFIECSCLNNNPKILELLLDNNCFNDIKRSFSNSMNNKNIRCVEIFLNKAKNNKIIRDQIRYTTTHWTLTWSPEIINLFKIKK